MRHPRDDNILFERMGKSCSEYCTIQVIQSYSSFVAGTELAFIQAKKDHPAQLRAFAQLLADHPTYTSGPSSVKLVLLVARNAEDRARVQSLKDLAENSR
jgi:hypothetical protein